MAPESSIALLSQLSAGTEGVFRGKVAAAHGVTRRELGKLVAAGAVERAHPDTYRMTAVARTSEQRLRAALLWAGDDAAAAGRSAGRVYKLEGVRDELPEIVAPRARHRRTPGVIVHRPRKTHALMLRTHGSWRVTGIEATLVTLAAVLDLEALEVAFEDARRRGLTSVPAMLAYLDRFAKSGVPGVMSIRRLVRELDPVNAARSTLEVKTRRLLVAHGIRDFVREFPLAGDVRTYHYDFAFPAQRTILETNGRRWHDDPVDYERDNEKWSVPARHGYRIVFATWTKVTKQPAGLLAELLATLAA